MKYTAGNLCDCYDITASYAIMWQNHTRIKQMLQNWSDFDPALADPGMFNP